MLGVKGCNACTGCLFVFSFANMFFSHLEMLKKWARAPTEPRRRCARRVGRADWLHGDHPLGPRELALWGQRPAGPRHRDP